MSGIEVESILSHIMNNKLETNHKDKNKKKEKSEIRKVDFFLMNEIRIMNIISRMPREERRRYEVIKGIERLNVMSVGEEIEEVINNVEKDEYMLVKCADMDIDYGNINVLLHGQDERGYVKNIIESYKYILSSIWKLNKEGIIFYDFGNEKMKFEKERANNDGMLNNHGILTGFERSILKNDLQNENKKELLQDLRRYVKEEDKSLKPFEIYILCEVVELNRNEEMRSEKYEKIKSEYLEEMKNILGDRLSVRELENECDELIGGMKGKSRNEQIKILLQGYESWDNYSISLFYLYIIKNIESDDKETNKIIAGLMKIMRCNISCNMGKRCTIEETQEKLKEIMKMI